MSTRTKKEKITFELSEKTIAIAEMLVAQMQKEAKEQAPKNQAAAFIQQYIKQIDSLSEAGFTLSQIYERFNQKLKLGISASSFVQYVRAVRKETGSKFYRTVEQRKSKKEAVKEAVVEQKVDSIAAESTHDLYCPKCVDAKKMDIGGIVVYRCEACGSDYAADKNGAMLKQKLN